MKTKILVVCSAFAGFIWAAEALGASGSFEETVRVDEPIHLDVSTGSGSITVSVGDAGRVEIRGDIDVRSRGLFGFSGRSRDEAEAMVDEIAANPPVELRGDSLRVGYFKDKRFRKNVSLSFEIVVPARTSVTADSGSGAVTISGVSGDVLADTGSGRVRLSDITGSVTADTGSGSVRAENIAGAFSADTGSGSVWLSQTEPGDVNVSTGSGSCELLGVVGALKADTGSGRITVDGEMAGPWYLDTGSGSVSVTLPADAAFRLDADSSSGGISIDHPLTVTGKVSKRHLRGEVRGGGELLKIDTGSGGIRIR